MTEAMTTDARRRSVEVVVPVYNEAHVLADSISRLHTYLENSFPFPFTITVADKASTDRTWQVVTDLSGYLPHVRAVHLDEKGRGRALKHVWSRSTADVVAYMDVDLSTVLDGFLPLVAPLLSRHSDISIGSGPDSRVDIVRTALDDLRGMARVLKLRMAGADRIAGLARQTAADADESGAVARTAPRPTRRPVPSFAVLASVASAAYLALVLQSGAAS